MDINNMKNIVVLKNLPSNMIEEAFVILKQNVNIHKLEILDNKNGKISKENKSIAKECVVKEAEMIVQEYINRINRNIYENSEKNINITKKYKKLKAISIFLAVFSFLCIISTLIR